jgi:large subunit ribosomal protein L3
MNKIYAIKAAMTQAWDNAGKRVAITVVKTPSMVVTAVKTVESDGYDAVQVGLGSRKAKQVSKPVKNQLKAVVTGDTYPRYVREIRLSSAATDYTLGQTVAIDTILSVGDKVNVAGVTRGHGFEGVMKRWGFHGGPRTHGQSDRARAPGSIGQGTDPGRVHKGKKMAGHYGAVKHHLKDLTVVKIDTDNQEVWLSGPIPGVWGTLVEIIVTGKTKFPGLRQATNITEKPEAEAETETKVSQE